MRKGQTALEYLITYGWAILVILVVTAVLWYYGIFNPSKWTGDQVAGFSSFTIAQGSYTITKTGGMTLILGNKVGDRLQVTGVNISGNDCWNENNHYTNTSGGSDILPGGQSGILTIGTASNWSCIASLRSGDMVTLNVKIIFDDKTTTLTGKTDAGTMMVKLG